MSEGRALLQAVLDGLRRGTGTVIAPDGTFVHARHVAAVAVVGYSQSTLEVHLVGGTTLLLGVQSDGGRWEFTT